VCELGLAGWRRLEPEEAKRTRKSHQCAITMCIFLFLLEREREREGLM
jgi:hypothetical protein